MNDVQQQNNSTNKDLMQKARTVLGAKLSPKLLISACAAVISLVLLILSFCPIITYTATVTEDEISCSSSVGVSTLQNIGFFFDSLLSKDEKALKKSNLYKKIDDLEEELEEYGEDLEESLEEKLEDEDDMDEEELDELYQYYGEKYLQKEVMLEQKATFLLFRMALQSSHVGPTVFSFASLFASIALIVVCALMLLFSVLSLFKEWNGQDAEQSQKQHNRIYKLLVAIPMLFVLSFLFCMLGRSVNDVAMFRAVYYSTTIAGSAILALVLSFAAIVAVIVWKVKCGELKMEKKVVRRIISAVVAFTILCLTGTSFFTVKIDGEIVNDGSDVLVPLNLNLFGMSVSSAGMADFVEDCMGTSEDGWVNQIESALNRFDYYGTSIGEDACKTVVSLVLPAVAVSASQSSEGQIVFAILFYPIIVLNLIIMLLSAAIFYADTANLLTVNNDQKRHGGFRVWNHILHLILIGILALFMLLMNEEAFEEVDTIKVMLGSIVWIYPLTVLSLIFRPRKEKKEKANANLENNS